MCLTISRLLWKNAVGCGIIYKSDWEDTVTTDTENRTAAAKFAAKDQGDEKQETQRFWVELLTKVFSIDGSTAIAFEVPVKLDYTSFRTCLVSI